MSEFFEFLFISPWSPRHFLALGLQIGLGVLLAFFEASGRFHLPLGKFRRTSTSGGPWTARAGLALANLVPLLVYVGGYMYFGAPVSPYHNALLGAFILIFGMRVLEAFFLNRPSAGYSPAVLTGIAIAWSAVAWLATRIHNDYTSVYVVYERPFEVLTWWGLGVLLLGTALSTGHRYLLARTRVRRREANAKAGGTDAKDARYPLPRGGLFHYVVCPHYLGDILIWLGFAMMSRHVALYGIAFIVAAYLAGRAHGTLRWYRLREEPARRLKSLVPFVL